MLVPTSEVMVKQRGKKHDTYDKTIKVSFHHMDSVQPSQSGFNRCNFCPAILIRPFSEFVDKVGQLYRWKCGFCFNINESDRITFPPNPYKYCLHKNVPNELHPPIILFVIDCSASMNESIFVSGSTSQLKDEKLTPLSAEFGKIITESHFYHKQKQWLNQLQETYSYQHHKGKYQEYIKGDDYFSKIVFFMALIQQHIKEYGSQYQRHRIGFIFFNQVIYILKPYLQKFVNVIVPDQSMKKGFPFKNQVANFNSYDHMLEKGKQHYQYFADCGFKKVKLSQVAFETLKVEGTTALGPAIAFSLGLISAHDVGSKIILVTDCALNHGILSREGEQNASIYQHMLSVLEDKKAVIGVLNCFHQNLTLYEQKRLENNPMKQDFQKNLLKANSELIVEMAIRFEKDVQQASLLNKMNSSIQNLLKKAVRNEKIVMDIAVDNQQVNIKKFKFDPKDYQTIKYIGLQKENWLELDISKVSDLNTLFPITTQIVMTYIDVLTKQKYLFMSYCTQKIAKDEAAVEATTSLYLQSFNRENLDQIFDLEKEYFQSLSFRSEDKQIEKLKNQSLKGPLISIISENEKSQDEAEQDYF